MKNILCLCGSLRAASNNLALLRAAKMLAPANMNLEIWTEADQLPHFNPDMEAGPLPTSITVLRAQASQCDGILIACPEYARGIPGSFKNVLDWLVGSETFFGSRVVLFNASPRAFEAQNALRLVLTTMAAQIIEEACINLPLLAKNYTISQISDDPALANEIRRALNLFATAIA